MMGIGRRLRKEEDGYALIVSVILLFVMMMLLVVGLQAGNSALDQSQRGIEWTRTLTVAESGINDAVSRLSADRAAVNPCPISGSIACTGEGGEYQIAWTDSGRSVVIRSIGYYPELDTAEMSRTVQVTLEPVPTFRYALFSSDVLTVKNNQTIVGDIYSQLGVVIGTGTKVCGSIVVANGGAALQNSSQVVKELVDPACSGKEGLVWTGGPDGIELENGVVIEGDAKASAPTTEPCSTSNPDYGIVGGSILGDATACGGISSSVSPGTPSGGTNTTTPAVIDLPAYTFDAANYPGIYCYPSPPCEETNTDPNAVTTANAALAPLKANLSGVWAIWQESPSSSTPVDLEGVGGTTLTLAGDTTIVTNAPIDFGNTEEIQLAPGVRAADLVVISLFVPPPGTSCSVNDGDDCSMYGVNSIEFAAGDADVPDDGIAALLYTTGKMAFKNNPEGEGALYAGSMDIKNGFEVTYNSRIERVLGFGTSLETVLWEELDPS